MTPLVPILRPEIDVARSAGSVVLGDPVLRRRLDLGDIGAVLDAMDGRDAEAVVATCGPASEAVLRTLMLLGFLDGPGRATVERMRALASGALPLEPRFLPESRFACQGSGGCCQNYVFGPLTDADVARISSLNLAPFGLDEPFYETRARPDGRPERFLRTTEEGRCRFLAPGNRCGLHARWGAASKPGFCQLFPLVPFPTIEGLAIVDGGECASFPASARAGPSLSEQFESVQAALPDNLPLSHPVVHPQPGAPCDYGWFVPLKRALIERVGGSPAACLRDLGRRVDAWRLALRTCPLVDGEPDASIDLAVSGDLDAPTAVATPIAPVAAELVAVFASALKQPAPPPFTLEICRALLAIAEGDPMPPPPPDEHELFRLTTRSYLFGPRALVEGRPMAALLRLALGWLVTRHGGPLGQLLATRRLYMPWAPVTRVLLRHEGAARGILEGLA